ncbi:MAG: T9SS type A sorting domain-containing protein [Gemmatimonadetes bacterium]|nr:T9SS type A sorting domain-containing protein [Gemmatimonadota bacterium]
MGFDPGNKRLQSGLLLAALLAMAAGGTRVMAAPCVEFDLDGQLGNGPDMFRQYVGDTVEVAVWLIPDEPIIGALVTVCVNPGILTLLPTTGPEDDCVQGYPQPETSPDCRAFEAGTICNGPFVEPTMLGKVLGRVLVENDTVRFSLEAASSFLVNAQYEQKNLSCFQEASVVCTLAFDPLRLFRSESVDPFIAHHGMSSSFALYQDTIPNIVYNVDDGNYTKFARKIGANWTYEVVDSLPGNLQEIAIDSNGVPQVAYSAFRELKYARRSEDGWILETVEDTLREGVRNLDIEVDRQGNPHIVYGIGGRTGFREERYAHKVDDEWVIEIFDYGECHGIALALDDQDAPHVAYASAGRKYAWKEDGAWTIQLIDSEHVVGFDNSIALGDDGTIHISCTIYSGQSGYLLYSSRVDGVWTSVQPFHSPVNHGGGSSICLDRAGRPYIVFHYGRRPDEDLYYTRMIDGTWYTDPLDDTHRVRAAYPSTLVLDSRGRLHVSYGDTRKDQVLYGTSRRSSPRVKMDPAAVAEEQVRDGFPPSLIRLYPNPARNQDVTIDLSRSGPGAIPEISIYSINGRLIRTLNGSSVSGSRLPVIWDGMDSRGNSVSSGTYLIQVQTRGDVSTRRVTIVR